jgi:hypothetical protein
MNTPTFSTVADTSEVSDRVQETLARAKSLLGVEKTEKLRAIQQRIQRLEARGFLRRQRFSEMTSADFERRYMTGQSYAPTFRP